VPGQWLGTDGEVDAGPLWEGGQRVSHTQRTPPPPTHPQPIDATALAWARTKSSGRQLSSPRSYSSLRSRHLRA
jgi:hypothetical protein